MAAKTNRVRARQVWIQADGWSEWHALATEKHIDFCCDCGLAHEVQYAVFLRKDSKIGKLLPRNGTLVMRRVALAPARTAGRRRAKRLKAIAKAIKARN